MTISASELALAYPDVSGPLPHALQMMVGQKVVFGVHLPRQSRPSTYEDFRISKIWGLNLPRAQLLAQLPPPQLPYRTPSPPSRHETPIPPDPAYVPPIPTYRRESDIPSPEPVRSPSPTSSDVPAPVAAPKKRKNASVRPATRTKTSPGANKSTVPAPPPGTPAQPHSRVVSSVARVDVHSHKLYQPRPAWRFLCEYWYPY